ncbi:MAG: hypothetical protein H0V11_01735 [Actinobacteria bacterium]|nr:hypothetical protein [Actinomycetota bacterium]
MSARRVKAFAAVGTIALLLLAAPASAAPPRAGVLAPAKSLGGLALGATPAQVRAAWGPRHGTCRGCRAPTWYFNFARFEPEGAGVTFRGGRAVALFTIWAPKGWRTDRGLKIGDDASRATTLYRGLVRIACGTYYALTLNGANAVTSIYVHDEKVWGFGLSRPREPVCR